MTTATNNGSTQRKQVSDQLDRFDAILDGMSEAIAEVVADAVRGVIAHAVSEAVHAAVKEVLSSQELLHAAMQKHVPVETMLVPKPPTVKENVLRIANGLREKGKQAASLAKKKLTEVCASVGKIAANAPIIMSMVAKAAWALRKPCIIALGVGMVFGVACYFGGQLFSSVVNGMSATAITFSTLTLPLKRLFWDGNS